MTDLSPTIAGQISAIIVVLRELITRLPASEQAKLKTSIDARVARLSGLDESAQEVVAAIEKTLSGIFIAPSPKSDG